MPVRNISNGEVIGFYNSSDDNESVFLSPAYCPDDMPKNMG